MLSECKKQKIKFVEELNEALKGKFNNIEKISYEVYDNGYYEFLVVDYVGGAKSVKDCYGNSNSAIFRELGKLLDNGYYDQLDYYEKVKANSVLEK